MAQELVDITKVIGNDVSKLDIVSKEIEPSEEETIKTYFVTKQNNRFFPFPIKGGIVHSNEYNLVESIFIDFDYMFDDTFYTYLVDKYGEPDTMYCKDEILNKKKWKLQNDITSHEIDVSLKECSFQDNPNLIEWKFDNIKMSFTISYKNGITQVMIEKE